MNTMVSTDPLTLARGLEREPHQTMGITWGAHLISGKHFYYSARYQSDASIALGPILKMYIPGQIRIYNALSSDGYSTGNAPPSGNNYTIVWFLRALHWYIGPTAMPRAAVTPIAPERSEGAIGCDSRPRHCRGDDIPAWRPNKIMLLSLLPLDLTMHHHFISLLRAV